MIVAVYQNIKIDVKWDPLKQFVIRRGIFVKMRLVCWIFSLPDIDLKDLHPWGTFYIYPYSPLRVPFPQVQYRMILQDLSWTVHLYLLDSVLAWNPHQSDPMTIYQFFQDFKMVWHQGRGNHVRFWCLQSRPTVRKCRSPLLWEIHVVHTVHCVNFGLDILGVDPRDFR